MSMPIPSGLANLPVIEVRRSTDIPPTNPTTGINGVTPMDPRQVLQMAEPVVTAEQSSLARESLQRNFQENLNPNSSRPREPTTSQAVLLEISNTNQRSTLAPGVSSNVLTANLTQDTETNLVGAGVNLPNSPNQIASPEVMKLNQLIATVLQNTTSNLSSDLGQAQNAVQWPGMIPSPATQILGNTANVALQSQLMTNALTANDPKTAMANLKKDLKNSGLFAAEQLAQVLMPSPEDPVSLPTSDQKTASPEMAQVATALLKGLESNSQQLIDSIKLALKGDLVWQGMLLPQVPATMVREDAWQANPQDPSQIEKGTRISVAITLPNLGMIQVIGTQFRDQLHVAIEVPETSKVELQSQMEQLQINLQEQVPIDANIQLKDIPRG
jgi:hypothetical protein